MPLEPPVTSAARSAICPPASGVLGPGLYPTRRSRGGAAGGAALPYALSRARAGVWKVARVCGRDDDGAGELRWRRELARRADDSDGAAGAGLPCGRHED